jgi:hypothetical protein
VAQAGYKPESLFFPFQSPPERGFITKVLRRAFDAQEIDDIKEGLGQRKDLSRSPRVMLTEILRLRQQGKSLSEIGRLLGFTHQAIGRALC